jgi:hypothetical protein
LFAVAFFLPGRAKELSATLRRIQEGMEIEMQ